MQRVYLDYNATAPLRSEAREAMIVAMEVMGNPSSVHAEGRAAKAIVEKARAQVADAMGASGADVIFTSSATEAAALGLAGRDLHGAAVEHDAVGSWVDASLPVDGDGRVRVTDASRSVLQLANSETGVMQSLPEGLALSDDAGLWQGTCRVFMVRGADGVISAHKLGGPKGIGALVVRQGVDVPAQIKGGGQEMGRRSGTENVIGIAGFGAAAAAAQDLETGVWSGVEEFRNILK